MSDYHIPVLLKECVEGLNINPDGTYVDVTFGGGGHSTAILNRLKNGKLFAFDQDEDAIRNLPENSQFFFIHGNFRYLKNYLHYEGIRAIDGLLADLGVSSHHFNTPGRGFSYRSEAALDMRMNRNSHLTAEMVINDYDAAALSDIFYKYGELFQARKIAATLTENRRNQRITTTAQLAEAISSLTPKQSENQFLSKVFQALRIEVNHELESLEEMLSAATEMLNPGGRLVILSYHSLEDRMVKNFMRWGNPSEQPAKDVFGNMKEPFKLITRKPVSAGEEEIVANPRARSARLRIAEKK